MVTFTYYTAILSFACSVFALVYFISSLKYIETNGV